MRIGSTERLEHNLPKDAPEHTGLVRSFDFMFDFYRPGRVSDAGHRHAANMQPRSSVLRGA